LVSVKLPLENGVVQVADIREYEPARVDVAPVVAVAVPPSCPAHAGFEGMPPGETVME